MLMWTSLLKIIKGRTILVERTIKMRFSGDWNNIITVRAMTMMTTTMMTRLNDNWQVRLVMAMTMTMSMAAMKMMMIMTVMLSTMMSASTKIMIWIMMIIMIVMIGIMMRWGMT